MESLGFSTFRQLIDAWDEQVEKDQQEKQVRNLVDGKGLLLFFKFDGDVFGAGEDGRVVFARIKNPDKDEKEWGKDASFSALNLTKTVSGEQTSSIFGSKDLDKIKVIDRDAAVKALCKEELDGDVDIQDVDDDGDPKPDNFIHTMEQ